MPKNYFIDPEFREEAAQLRADAERMTAALFAEVEAYEARASNNGRVTRLADAG